MGWVIMKSVTGSCGERIHPDVTEAILALDLLYIVVLDSYVQHTEVWWIRLRF